MNRTVSVLAGLGPALFLALLGGCLSTPSVECRRLGQILWERGCDPARDAPEWTRGGNAAFRAAGIRSWEVPMLRRYAVWLKNRLNADEFARLAGKE